MSPAPPLRLAGIDKRFGGVRAVCGVDLVVAAGELLGLVGENGAGKSTLMKIAGGIHAPDSGAVEVDGRAVAFADAAASLGAGVAVIHQELSLADNLSVAENLFLGRQPVRGRLGLLRDRRALAERSARALARVGLGVAPETPTARLGPGARQLLEIARALDRAARVLLLDEPTSSLTAAESEILFERLAALRRDGVALVYVSHRLDEVERLADRVQVLRDGATAGILERPVRKADMIRLMLGRAVADRRRQPQARAGAEPALEVRGLRLGPRQDCINLRVGRGELVGVAGLVGAGRTRLLRTLAGLRPAHGGEVRLLGRPLAARSPGDAIRAGLALVPEERQRHGLVLPLDITANLAHGRAALATGSWRRRADEHARAAAAIERLGIRTSGPAATVADLSGGNQQKVVLAKWLEAGPKVLLLDEPTRGVDVGARHEIYALLDGLMAKGLGALLVSSDVEEILAVCDRVLVMRDGRIAGELTGAGLTEEGILRLMVGAGAA